MDDHESPRIELKLQPAPWETRGALPPRLPPKMFFDGQALIRRAYAAYYRSGEDPAWTPDKSMSGVVPLEDKLYVVLRNNQETLAVYRVRNCDHVLKRLRRWPQALEEYKIDRWGIGHRRSKSRAK